MKKLYVYADFDWLKEVELIGELGYESLRGTLYMLNRKTAEKIVSEVVEAVKGWRELATRLGISKKEVEMFSGVFDERVL